MSQISTYLRKQPLELYRPDRTTPQYFTLFSYRIPAGFPSPADDHLDKKIDLNEHLVQNPAATFFIKVSGDSMIDCNIHDGDVLIVDRSVEASEGNIIVGLVDGEFTVKCFSKRNGKVYLQPANPKYKPLEITEGMEFSIWGVVVYVVHKSL
jgi:DNA polymerase V